MTPFASSWPRASPYSPSPSVALFLKVSKVIPLSSNVFTASSGYLRKSKSINPISDGGMVEFMSLPIGGVAKNELNAVIRLKTALITTFKIDSIINTPYI